jgi:hypothetical protein
VPEGLRGFSYLTQHSASLHAGLSCHAPAALCFSSFLLHCQKEKLVLTQTLKSFPVTKRSEGDFFAACEGVPFQNSVEFIRELAGRHPSSLLAPAKFGNKHFLLRLRHTIYVAKDFPVSVERTRCQQQQGQVRDPGIAIAPS